VLLVKFDGPIGGFPGPDENPAFDLPQQVREQFSADASAAHFRSDIGVADERDILDRLHSHDADKEAVFVVTPEFYARRDFVLQSLRAKPGQYQFPRILHRSGNNLAPSALSHPVIWRWREFGCDL